jgi:hypothetical protein
MLAGSALSARRAARLKVAGEQAAAARVRLAARVHASTALSLFGQTGITPNHGAP